MNDNISTEVEEQVREIARQEAQDVYDVQVEDGEGSTWTLSSIMQRFEVDRRTALKALGLVALGYTAPIAVLKSVSGTAEAAATDDLTVPGTLDAGAVSTGSLSIGSETVTRQFHEVQEITSDLDDTGVDVSLNSRDMVIIEFKNIRDELHLTIGNNTSAGYQYLSADSSGTVSRSTDDSKFVVADDDFAGELFIYKAGFSRPAVEFVGSGRFSQSTTVLWRGELNNVQSLSSVQLFAPSGNTVSVEGSISVREII